MRYRPLVIVGLCLLAVAGGFAASAVARSPGARATCAADARDRGRYEVSLGTFKSKQAAALAARVRRLGLGVRLEREKCTSTYEVAVGRFASRTAAARMLAHLKRLGFRGSVEFDPPVKVTTQPGTTTTSRTTTTQTAT